MDAPNNSARFMCWQHEMGGWSAIYMYRNLGLLKPFHPSKTCEMVNKPLLFKRKLFTEMGKMTRSNFLHFFPNRTEWNIRRSSPSFSSMQEQGHFPRPIEAIQDPPGKPAWKSKRHGSDTFIGLRANSITILVFAQTENLTVIKVETYFCSRTKFDS